MRRRGVFSFFPRRWNRSRDAAGARPAGTEGAGGTPQSLLCSNRGRRVWAEPSLGPRLRCRFAPPAFRFESDREALGARIPPGNGEGCPLRPSCCRTRRGDPRGTKDPARDALTPAHPRGPHQEVNEKSNWRKPPAAWTTGLRAERFLPLLPTKRGNHGRPCSQTPSTRKAKLQGPCFGLEEPASRAPPTAGPPSRGSHFLPFLASCK